MRSRAAALGWGAVSDVVVAVGAAPDNEPQQVIAAIQRAARSAQLPVMAGVHGDRLLVVLGEVADPCAAVDRVINEFGDGPVVIGPTAADLPSATPSAAAALAGLRAAPAWPAAPRPVLAVDLLPERALNGDEDARWQLVAEVHAPLAAERGAVLETLAAYLDRGGALESTARALFVHPNTVRYRLRRVSELTGLSPTDPRDAYALAIALSLGRLAQHE
jgi:hypothetical protein